MEMDGRGDPCGRPGSTTTTFTGSTTTTFTGSTTTTFTKRDGDGMVGATLAVALVLPRRHLPSVMGMGW